MALRMLRQFAAVVAKELAEQYSAELAVQPGRLFFPKRVHELDEREGEAPDGLSLAYIRLAAAKNGARAATAEIDGAVNMLAFHISRQICRAAVLERRLLEKLKMPE